MRGNQRDHAVAAEPKAVHPVGQPIRVPTNSGLNAPLCQFRSRDEKPPPPVYAPTGPSFDSPYPLHAVRCMIRG